VIVVAENVTAKDLDSLKNRKLPFLIVGKTNLSGPRLPLDRAEEISINHPSTTRIESHFFFAGQLAANALNRAFLTGEPITDFDKLRRSEADFNITIH